jgi:16S rRNA (guanine966-N2)-methyltransferase
MFNWFSLRIKLGQVRIIGGIHRSRILKFKDFVSGLRPTPDRVRETVFNWLGQTLAGKTCLDLFAGSGAMGFEAVSRGAKSVLMVEANRGIYIDLISNARLLKANNVELKNQDALNYTRQSILSFDIIFIDPPYASNLLQQCLSELRLGKLINESTVLYIEYKILPDLTGYQILKQSKAGMVHFALLKAIGCSSSKGTNPVIS